MTQRKYPICSGRDVIKALEKIGYVVVSQKGSHVKLKKKNKDRSHIIVVPLHKELDKGTLISIIHKVGHFYPEEEFIKILKTII